jgi:hypothetical protein
MQEMAAAVGDTALAADAARRFPVARRSLEEKFWMPEPRRFAFALLDGNRLNANLTVWPATAMSWHLFDEARGQSQSSALARATISTDWGGRSLAAESELYDPLHYNNGTVWPFVTGFLALAQYRYHNVYAGREQLDAIGRTFDVWGLGRNPEVFSGAAFEPLETAVPQQFFATSQYLNALIRGALGIEADAPRGVLRIAPQLFATPGTVPLTGVRVGDIVLDVTITVTDSVQRVLVRRASGVGALSLEIEPALAPGSRARRVTVDGRAVSCPTEDVGRALLVKCAVRLAAGASGTEVAVRQDGGWRLWTDEPEVRRGDRSSRIKVLEARVDSAGAFVLDLEGRAGRRYELLVREPGGRVRRETVQMPEGPGDARDGYLRISRRLRPQE